MARSARRYDQITIPVSAPAEWPIIILEIDAADCRALVQGIVPEHVKANCLSCLELCEETEDRP